MKVAPALAARRAWRGEKQRVTLTPIPSLLSCRQAFSPSSVSGTLMTMLGCSPASFLPSESMVSASSPTTSALTGPSTISAISRKISLASFPPALRARRVGLVVTPSMSPASAARRISLMSAVSRKIFIALAKGVEGKP